MKIKRNNDPWEYYEISEILNEEELNKAKEYSSLYSVPEEKRHKNFVENHNPVYQIFKKVIVDFCKQIDFNTNGKYFLLENSICGPKFKYNSIHQDNENKALTMVFYLSESNLGTKLFRDKTTDSFVKYSNWVQNGAMAFVRTPETYHDFESNDNLRKTFNLIVVNKKFIGVDVNYEPL
jgi:hypothetical protein